MEARAWSLATVALSKQPRMTRTPLGGEPKSVEWIGHWRRASAALERAVAVGQVDGGITVEAPASVPTLAG